MITCLLHGTLFGGCAAPIEVSTVSPQESYTLRTNALGAGKQASTKAQAELQGMGWELYPNAQAALLPNKAGKG